MSRKITHNNTTIQSIQMFQYTLNSDGDPQDLRPSKDVKQNKSFELAPVPDKEPYYLEFQFKVPEIRQNREVSYFTIDFGKRYGIKKVTRKKHDKKPNVDRVIYLVHNLDKPFGPTDKNGDVDVKDPDDEPFLPGKS